MGTTSFPGLFPSSRERTEGKAMETRLGWEWRGDVVRQSDVTMSVV